MEANAPNFKALEYARARPVYPPEIFKSLLRTMGTMGTVENFLDLGCGTGQSTHSFSRLSRAKKGTGIDIDPEMVAGAVRSFGAANESLHFQVGAAENLPQLRGSVDLVLIGSAIHWFNIPRVKSEIERVLALNGLLFVFEYQFPKCVSNAELAEGVRRRFNLEWRAPVQKPRGSLAELMTPFQADPHWQFVTEDRPEWEETLHLEGFLSHLFTQSRYLHAEGAAPDPESYRAGVSDFFRPYFASERLRFDLKPRTSLWKRIAQSEG